jgi:Viral BACON domain
VITAADGSTWGIGNNAILLRNGQWFMDWQVHAIEINSGSIFVTGTDDNWYAYSGGDAGSFSLSADPCNGIPTPTPLPPNPTPTPTPSCSFSVAPSSLSFGASGGSMSIGVTPSDSTCTWTAIANSSWLAVSSTATLATVTAAANASASALSGTVTVAGVSISVTEAATPYVYPYAPVSAVVFSPDGSTTILTLAIDPTAVSCNLTAQTALVLPVPVGAGRNVFIGWDDRTNSGQQCQVNVGAQLATSLPACSAAPCPIFPITLKDSDGIGSQRATVTRVP